MTRLLSLIDNSRVVRFAADGTFKNIIGGTKGTKPGQFNLPHAVVADSRGRIIVADASSRNGQRRHRWR